MRRSATPIVFGFLLLMIAFVYFAQAAFIVQWIGVVDKVEGTVEVKRQGRGNWIRLKEEAFVQTGDLVRTFEDSRLEIRWTDGTRMRVDPHSRLRITKSTLNTLKKTKRSEFKLDIGKVWIRIIHALRSESKFEISTPTATASVRGTVFSVEVTATGSTRVSVYEGNVHIRAGRQDIATSGGLAADVAARNVAPRTAALTPDEENTWRQQTGIVTPALNVRQPSGDITVTDSSLTLSGTVEPTATLTVNGNTVERSPLKKDQFKYTLTLQPGPNVLHIVATDAKGVSTEITRTVTLR